MAISKSNIKLLTCGSVDNGKSTLIGRMLYDTKRVHTDRLNKVLTEGRTFDPSLLLDGLKAEREQGITIDISYQYLSTDAHNIIIADSPGHEQYTRNMVTASTVSDIAVIVVDATRGIETQTIRHTFICSMFGIKNIILAINKMDAIDWDENVYNDMVNEFYDKTNKINIGLIKCIPISALTGQNIVNRHELDWYTGNTFFDELESINKISKNNNVDLRLPIQLQVRDNGSRYYMGTIATGILRCGDEIAVCPSNVVTKIKSLMLCGEKVSEASSGVAVSFETEDQIDISRGDIITKTGNIIECVSDITANIIWMSKSKLDKSRDYIIKSLSNSISCSISDIKFKINMNTLSHIDTDDIYVNDVARIEIEPHDEICLEQFYRNDKTGSFILIDRYTNETVATGIVIQRTSL